jgi:2-polyprenyl-6-methoxyphenol hydroxylase-like FAD-dependent oxidoreductase
VDFNAAHTLLRHTGQGAAPAIVDALALARATASEPDLERPAVVRTAPAVEDRRCSPRAAGTARLLRTRIPFASAVRELAVRIAVESHSPLVAIAAGGSASLGGIAVPAVMNARRRLDHTRAAATGAGANRRLAGLVR